MRVNTDTGTVTPLYSGLQMANGVARAPDGTIYASNDLGLAGIDRVKNGKVENGWGKVFSANGLAIDPFGPYLYAAQTFQPAAIARVNTDTGAVSTYVQFGIGDIAAGPDGMTIDQLGRLFVAANLYGEVWRVDRDRSSCAVVKGLTNTSAVAFGSSLGGDGFPAENLYAVGFDGTVTEIPDARPRPATTVAAPQGERLVLRVSPRRFRAGRKVRFKLRVTFRSPTGERRRAAGTRPSGQQGRAHGQARARDGGAPLPQGRRRARAGDHQPQAAPVADAEDPAAALGPRGLRRRARQRSAWCSRCAWSTARTTASGLATPSKVNSLSSDPAVSKSTVPIWRIRSSTPWSVFTFCTRSRRASCVLRAMMPRLMCSRWLVIV